MEGQIDTRFGGRERTTDVQLLKEVEQHADARLVEACRRGDNSAFDEIVLKYKDRVYNVVYRFLGNHEDAQDVAQEVFVRAYRGIEGFQGNAKVYTWLYSIAANLARNRLRDGARKGRNRGISLEALEVAAPEVAARALRSGKTPADEASAHEIEELLQQCLAELPDQYRLVFVLRTFDELSYEEIADAVGCPKGTVKSRLNQARTQLHRRLKELSAL